jgi:glucokinase
MLLAGDIGGTKTHLAIFSAEAGPRRALVEATFPSIEYPSLEVVVAAFLAGTSYPVTTACFGVAGPVVDGRATVTNLPWRMEVNELGRSLGVPTVHLINDLEAIATAVPFLEPVDLHTLNAGKPARGGAIGVVAPGTGLGEGFLTWDAAAGRYRAQPSEGGHASFAPHSPLEVELLSFLQSRFGHVSCERVCSGQGLRNIYAFLKASGHATEPAWLTERLAGVEDPNPIVVAAALDPREACEICALTVELFVAILGAEAGNLALKVLATGGMYLAGGIPLRIRPALDSGFMGAFCRKGRFQDLLAAIPVHVVINPATALFGAACYGLEHASRDGGE